MAKSAIISAAQAQFLTGKLYDKASYFNPVQDADGNWIISEEEVKAMKKFLSLPTSEQQKIKDIGVPLDQLTFIKDLTLLTHKPKVTEPQNPR